MWLYILGIFFEETLRISHRISITCGSTAKVNVNISIIIVPEKVVQKITVNKVIMLMMVIMLVKITVIIIGMVEIIQVLLE